ncbi:MAG: helix-turn-helix transcriptional regulator [Bacillota bacterium]
MLDLPGYTISEKLHVREGMSFYRGHATNDRRPVIVKALDTRAATPLEISRLMREYEISRSVDIADIVQPSRLEQAGPVLALVTEDTGAIPLRSYLLNRSADLWNFLDIAVRLTESLVRLHQNGIIHGGLKPESILVHPHTKKIYLTDFGDASSPTLQTNQSPSSSSPGGAWEYIAPEQTGRLRVAIDHRTDLYALGVVFYEMITHRLPLQAAGPAEMIYAHIAQQPLPPIDSNPGIPLAVSAMIMRLLAKEKEERYQSAAGLLWDLKECRRQLLQTGIIQSFSLGQADRYARLRLPRKLYGREREMAALQAAFDRARDAQGGVVLVSGSPGVGKTTLIKESLQAMVQENGWFLTGKFDQLAKNIPYAPFAAAFGQLIRQLMTESQEELDRWKGRLSHALGRNCAVVVQIVPELEWILGKQPPADVLPPKEAEHRLCMLFADFVRLFAQRGHPLVLFLDDLQWADPDSVHLLKYLTEDANLRSLLFVGAFRETEVDAAHPLMELLQADHLQGYHEQRIALMPLGRDQVMQLVAETLHDSPENLAALTDVLYRQSGGNPFFLGQVLLLIHAEGLLSFDAQQGGWEWDLAAIQELQPGVDVLALLLRKLQRLPEDIQAVLKLAACMGNSFHLQTIAALRGQAIEEIADLLVPLVQQGLVIVAGDEKENPRESSVQEAAACEFRHDWVQQAVYALISADEMQQLHLHLGRFMLQQHAGDHALADNILTIMDHFNRSLPLIHDPVERARLAQYNLLAGQKAKASAAHVSALQYFRSGVSLLSPDSWGSSYALSHQLHLELAQAEYLSGNLEAAERLFDLCLSRASTELERAGIQGLKVTLYASMGKYTAAVEIGVQALASLGVKLPIHPHKWDYARELLRYKWHLLHKRIEDLAHLPEMQDPVQRKISELLTRLSSVTMSSYPDLYGFIILKTGNHAVRYGNNEMAAVGYLGYSITAGSILGDYQAGERLGRVCVQLVERYDRSLFKCVIYFVVGAFISHWTQHGRIGLDYLSKALSTGMESGDVLIIGYAHCMMLENRYILGVPLNEIAQELEEKREIARRLKHENLALNVAIYDRVVSALCGDRAKSLLVCGERLQPQTLRLSEKDQSSLATCYLWRMQLCYLAGDFRESLAAAQSLQPLSEAILGFIASAEYNFYHSLAITALLDQVAEAEQRILWKTLRKNQRQMKRWAKSCQENFLHKYLLVAAETARLRGKREQAMSLYEQAIRSARQNGYRQNEALANELAAKFHLQQGWERIAATYLRDACRGYGSWGASAKVRELAERYPSLLQGAFPQEEAPSGETYEGLWIPALTYDEVASSLDFHALGRAVENVSQETDTSRLLESLLEMTVQSAGADSGYFILEQDGELFIEAAKNSGCSQATVVSVPLEESQQLSRAVVRYVARTLETVVLNCGESIGVFAKDPYISALRSGSIACLPLLLQGIPVGVLYLENSLMSRVFSPDRLQALKLLSTQIAYAQRLGSYLEEDLGKTGTGGRGYPQLVEPLTERETEVLRLIAAGFSNKEIAAKLRLTLNTVKTHIKHIYGKLQANRRVQVVERAKELGVL